MRCFVTGVAGFVGSHLAERLLQEGHEVYGLDGFLDFYPRALKERNLERARSWHTFHLLEANLLEIRLLPLLEGIDWIFHLAAQAGVRSSWGNEFSHYTNCNVLATQCLLEAALRVPTLRRFVYASSSSVYGDVGGSLLSETSIPHPISPYGVTKLAAEQLCQLYHENFALPTVSLRYFTVYGPRQRPDMAFHCFCKAIIERETIPLFSDGLQTRDFTYVSDIVEANMLAASCDDACGAILNIAGGATVTMRQVIKLLEEISGLSSTLRYGGGQPGDMRHTRADTTRAQALLGYHPRVSLREGLQQEFQDMVALYANTQQAVAHY